MLPPCTHMLLWPTTAPGALLGSYKATQESGPAAAPPSPGLSGGLLKGTLKVGSTPKTSPRSALGIGWQGPTPSSLASLARVYAGSKRPQPDPRPYCLLLSSSPSSRVRGHAQRTPDLYSPLIFEFRGQGARRGAQPVSTGPFCRAPMQEACNLRLGFKSLGFQASALKEGPGLFRPLTSEALAAPGCASVLRPSISSSPAPEPGRQEVVRDPCHP